MHSNKGLPFKILHSIPILITIGLISSIFSAFICFFTFEENSNYFMVLVLTPLVCLSTVLLTICYVKAIITNPGSYTTPPSYIESSETSTCDKCAKYKYPRSHHCRICDMCIRKMDHHCPWIGSCVGLKNQKFFFLFLVYATLGTTFSFIGLVSNYQNIDLAHYSSTKKYKNIEEVFWASIPALMHISSIILSFSVSLTLTVLLGTNTSQIARNATCIEDIKYLNKKESPYYRPDKKANIELVLGKGSFLSKMLPFSPELEGNEEPLNTSHSVQMYGSVGVSHTSEI